MPTKKNFLGGQQNYDPKTGEYESSLKGPNGESPSGFKSFKKSESSFDATNKKRMGKVSSADIVDDISDRMSQIEGDYSTEFLDDDEYKDAYKQLKADLEKNKNYLDADEYKSLNDQIDRVLGEGFDKNDEDSIWDAYEKGDITEKERNKLLSERSGKVAKGKTLKEKWNEYINNGFEGDDIDYYNNLIQEIESEMPFKDKKEHEKWLDLGATWSGEKEWLDMTEEIMSRKDNDELKPGSTVRIAKEFGDNSREFEVVKVEDKLKGVTIKEKGRDGITYQVDKSQLESYEPNNYSEKKVKPEDNPETYANDSFDKINNKRMGKSTDADELKTKQLQIILEKNPMKDDYHVGIRSIEDIKTFAETIDDDESFVYGDFSREDAKRALRKGKVKVYSSKPIAQGGFVSTSRNMAQDYAGSGKVYEQEVDLDSVAWINGDEGQLANTKSKSFSNFGKK